MWLYQFSFVFSSSVFSANSGGFFLSLYWLLLTSLQSLLHSDSGKEPTQRLHKETRKHRRSHSPHPRRGRCGSMDDMFLSFRGTDLYSKVFLSHLHKAFTDNAIHIQIDFRLGFQKLEYGFEAYGGACSRSSRQILLFTSVCRIDWNKYIPVIRQFL